MDRGVKQAALARACDISASYLNLIEHNRRPIGGALLIRIAQVLGVDPGLFSGTAEVQLAAAMDTAAAGHESVGPERDQAEELAGRFPGWARLIAAQQREIRRLEQVVERLDDRLTHDPFLSASMHSVLSSVTSIRSASAILAQGDDIEPEWEARFHRNIFEDSQRLAAATETLVEYLDSDSGASDANLPQDELDAWFAARSWHVAELETSEGADVDGVLDEAALLKSPAAKQIARGVLNRYARDAAALPLGSLQEALVDGISPIEMTARFGVGLPVVFRRLAALPPEALEGAPSFGLVACDGSGTLIFRKPLPGFGLPRYGAACPIWPLFQALQRPMTPILQALTVAGRDENSFNAWAIADLSYPAGYDGPAVLEAWMLFQPSMETESAARRVGTSCRICPETDCVARREPSVFLETSGL